jgi:beta-lactam-binding protein with PASTA domain
VISQFLSIAKPDQEKTLDDVVQIVLNDVTELLKMYGLSNDNSIKLSVEEGCSVFPSTR